MKLHWGNALVIYFAIFLGLAATFVIFSLKQNNDLEDEDYYNKGANYSQQIEIDKRSEIFTDSIIITQYADLLTINFANYLVDEANLMHIHFYRPSNEKLDYQLNYNSFTQKEQIAKTKLAKGRYIVKFTWQINQNDFSLEQTLFIE